MNGQVQIGNCGAKMEIGSISGTNVPSSFTTFTCRPSFFFSFFFIALEALHPTEQEQSNASYHILSCANSASRQRCSLSWRADVCGW